MKIGDLRISDFDYPLPQERIAIHPLAERDSCKLLVARPEGDVRHLHFSDLPDLLPADGLLVRNNTRVINARLHFQKSTGAVIEIFLLEPEEPTDYNLMFQQRSHCRWKCLVGNLKRWKDEPLHKELETESGKITLTASLAEKCEDGSCLVDLSWTPECDFGQVVTAAGRIPIPPYLQRESEDADLIDYQTIYAKIKGSVAAPTAGLHFTDRLDEQIRSKGVKLSEVTLHVGAGTFRPVKSETIGGHDMHTECFSIKRELVETLISFIREGRPITAVGTTTVRTLETLPWLGNAIASGDESLHVGQWDAYQTEFKGDAIDALTSLLGYFERQGVEEIQASTAIMIAPGFRWRVVGNIITNFHQPQSTLLLLVSSFLGTDANPWRWKDVYNEALANDYRFLSYGDACLFMR